MTDKRSIALTALRVDALDSGGQDRRDVYDAKVAGLVLRITRAGKKTWSYTYRVKGAARRSTLGEYPGVGVALARERATELALAVQRGGDPVLEQREVERQSAENGFAACVDDFIERYAKVKQKTWAETKRVLDKMAVPVWGNKPVAELRRRDVVLLVEAATKKHGANQGDKLRLHLHKMFRWLRQREVLEENPAADVSPLYKYVPRDRFLSDEEIVAFWKVTEGPSHFNRICRLVLLTGMRPGEAEGLRWDELDDKWAALPKTRMKNGRNFRAPLTPAAHLVIDSAPVFDGCPFVFSSNGRTHFSTTTKANKVAHAAMEKLLGKKIEWWTPHDLRRTLSTGLAALGVPNEVIDRVTAHVPKSSNVTAFVYNRHSYDAEAQRAVIAWANHVKKLVGQRQTALLGIALDGRDQVEALGS